MAHVEMVLQKSLGSEVNSLVEQRCGEPMLLVGVGCPL